MSTAKQRARFMHMSDGTYTILACFICLMVASFGIACNGGDGDETSEDCAQAESIWGQPEVELGGRCYEGGYGACPESYDNCIEGDCIYSDSANTRICTMTCTGDSDCTDLGYYCKEGVCQPAADCNTYCDEAMCCEYYNDPDDPTECLQGDCWML